MAKQSENTMFLCAINCTYKLTCVCAYTCECDHMRFKEQYVFENVFKCNTIILCCNVRDMF